MDRVTATDPRHKLLVSFLISHIKVLCQAVEAVSFVGLESAYSELSIMLRSDYVGSFSHARQAGLVCEQLETLVTSYLTADIRDKSSTRLESRHVTESTKSSAMYIQLVNELQSWLDSCTGKSEMALVLVRQRSMASVVSTLLQECLSLSDGSQLSVTHIVGHGGGHEAGMSVQQQSRRLADIRRGRYNITVATSVAEEGVDLPECDLVIQTDSVDCVRALVQVRGRARRPGSRFVVFCRDEAQRSQLNTLLTHEQHMIDVVTQLSSSSSSQ